MHISLQIIIAALSALGFYFCLKTLASLIFSNKCITASVIISDKKQLRNLDLLLDEASSALFTVRRRRLAVLVPNSIWTNCDEADQKLAHTHADEFGAVFYII